MAPLSFSLLVLCCTQQVKAMFTWRLDLKASAVFRTKSWITTAMNVVFIWSRYSVFIWSKSGKGSSLRIPQTFLLNPILVLWKPFVSERTRPPPLRWPHSSTSCQTSTPRQREREKKKQQPQRKDGHSGMWSGLLKPQLCSPGPHLFGICVVFLPLFTSAWTQPASEECFGRARVHEKLLFFI